MALPAKELFPLNTIFQRSPQEGLRSMPFYEIRLRNQPKNVFRIPDLPSAFLPGGENTIPIYITATRPRLGTIWQSIFEI